MTVFKSLRNFQFKTDFTCFDCPSFLHLSTISSRYWAFSVWPNDCWETVAYRHVWEQMFNWYNNHISLPVFLEIYSNVYIKKTNGKSRFPNFPLLISLFFFSHIYFNSPFSQVGPLWCKTWRHLSWDYQFASDISYSRSLRTSLMMRGLFLEAILFIHSSKYNIINIGKHWRSDSVFNSLTFSFVSSGSKSQGRREDCSYPWPPACCPWRPLQRYRGRVPSW